jgi:two-component system cell cycle response regulator
MGKSTTTGADATDRRLTRWIARGAAGRVIDLLTFRNMAVKQKFLYFGLGVSLWYVVIAAIGAWRQPDWSGLAAIAAALLIAHTLLILFAITATRSFTLPIHEINRQIRELTSGELTHLAPIQVTAHDEVGELTLRFNGLLDALRELQTFRKVIEQDDSTAEVLRRLERVFRDKGLTDHQILVLDPTGRHLRLASGEGMPRYCAASLAESAILCRAFKTGSTVASASYRGICPQFEDGTCDHRCIPLVLGGVTSGVVQVVHPRVEGVAADEMRTRVDRVRRFVDEALPVLEARRLTETLRESAMRDALTRLYNRRFLDEMAVKITSLVRRRQGSLGVIMCDLDHFKRVNDTHGHAVGDQVLREVAAALMESARTSDFVIRYGGEEFLLLLHDTDNAGAVCAAERMRLAVERKEIVTGGGSLHVTMSFGVSAYPSDNTLFSEAIRRADLALYGAKSAGRNRVLAHDTAAVPTAILPG